MNGDDYRIVLDTTVDGVRHVAAEPSGLVCCTRIDFDLKDGKIHNLRYTRGCHGNLQAIGRLLEGMDASKAAAILQGVDCHSRGTSCTDQLSRILTSLDK